MYFPATVLPQFILENYPFFQGISMTVCFSGSSSLSSHSSVTIYGMMDLDRGMILILCTLLILAFVGKKSTVLLLMVIILLWSLLRYWSLVFQIPKVSRCVLFRCEYIQVFFNSVESPGIIFASNVSLCGICYFPELLLVAFWNIFSSPCLLILLPQSCAAFWILSSDLFLILIISSACIIQCLTPVRP